MLNEYSRSYLEKQQLPVGHLSKLKFDSQVISRCDREWNEYLEALGITSKQAIKLVTEAGLLGSAIEHGLSPELIVLSDGAKQFVILIHALHTNAAENDIREYVTRRKISGGTRHDNGRMARDTFTGLKKTCRKLGLSFWQYLLSRITGDETVPYLPDVIRARASAPAPT